MVMIAVLVFTHTGTDAHRAITTSLHATESISESLDMLSSLPDSPEIGISCSIPCINWPSALAAAWHRLRPPTVSHHYTRLDQALKIIH